MQNQADTTRGQRREKEGTVLSDKMEKTVVVNVNRTFSHPKYKKVITRGRKYHAHDESNTLQIGDKVIIKECRPYSKNKRWCVVKKLEGKN